MREFIDLLKKINFENQLKKLGKKYAGKRILLYGAGLFFETIHNNYDLSGLNIAGISDKTKTQGNARTLYGYPAVRPEDIEKINPDVILVCVLNPVCLIESLKFDYNNKIKVAPLVNKGRAAFLREIIKI